MSKPEFVYTTYIETTAEKLWQALTDGDFTERYWFGHASPRTGRSARRIRFTKQGAPTIEGKVLESSTRRSGWPIPGTPVHRRRKRERTSRVTFDLEPRGKVIKLTVTHDNLDEGGKTLRNISGGWPMVLASLKSLLGDRTRPR